MQVSARPTEIPPDHLVESRVVRTKEISKFGSDGSWNVWVRSALARCKTLLRAVDVHAVESSSPVEVQLISTQTMLDPEKFFDLSQFVERVSNKVLTTDEMKLIQGEVPEPPGQVSVVDGTSDGLVRAVHIASGRMDGQVFEAGVELSAVQTGRVDLHVIGDGSGDRVTDDE